MGSLGRRFDTLEGCENNRVLLEFGNLLTGQNTHKKMVSFLEDQEKDTNKDFIRSLRTISHNLTRYKNSLVSLNHQLNGSVISTIRKIKLLLEREDIEKFVLETPLPIPESFNKPLETVETIAKMFSEQDYTKIFESPPDLEESEVDLFDDIFTEDTKKLLIQLNIVKDENGLPKSEGIEPLKGEKSATEKEWVANLDKTASWAVSKDTRAIINFVEKMIVEINRLLKKDHDELKEDIYPIVNLLVTLAQQLVTVELSVKSFVVNTMIGVYNKLYRYSQELDSQTDVMNVNI